MFIVAFSIIVVNLELKEFYLIILIIIINFKVKVILILIISIIIFNLIIINSIKFYFIDNFKLMNAI